MSIEVRKPEGLEKQVRGRLWPLILLTAVVASRAWWLEPVVARLLAS
jgi:hypothetical protein